MNKDLIGKLHKMLDGACRDLDLGESIYSDMPDVLVNLTSGAFVTGHVECGYTEEEDCLTIAEYKQKTGDDSFGISKISIIPYHAIQSIELLRKDFNNGI